MSEHANRNDRANVKRVAKARTHQAVLQTEALKALANPKRLLIVQTLSDGQERSVGDLQAILGISQSNMSQNLALLRAAGLVTARREANVVHYKIRDARVAKAVELLAAVTSDAAEDPTYITERADARRKENARRTTLVGASIVVALTALLLFAALHPLLNGGDIADVGRHVHVMVTSPDLSTMTTNCRDVVMAPQASAPMAL